MLGEKMRRHQVRCWLVNTGWIGGPYGVGERLSLPHTRAMVNAAITGELDDVPANPHPVFRVMVPRCCPGVPDHILDPAAQWKDAAAYDSAARALAARFQKNFTRFGAVDPAIAGAGPG
jgi:phosphoenolpyruvate carboxykinase (ATP)